MVSSKFLQLMVKCIFTPNEYLYMDLSRLESPSNAECNIQQMHPGSDQSCSVSCLFLKVIEGPVLKVKEGPVMWK